MAEFVPSAVDFTASLGGESEARVWRLASVDRADAVKQPGRPAASYLTVKDPEDVKIETLLSNMKEAWWMVYSIERAWLEDPALVLLEATDPEIQKKIWTGAFLDRSVRMHLPLNSRVAVVSLKTIEKWLDDQKAEEMTVKNDGSKFSYVANTGRCGSTLMHKLLLWTNRVVSLSEPQWSDQLMRGMAYEEASCDQLRRAAKACVCCDFFLAKQRFAVDDDVVYSLNPKGGSPRFQLILWTAYPGSRHVFMYRSCRKVVESFGSLGIMRGGAGNQNVILSPLVKRVPDLPETLTKLSSPPVIRLVNSWLTGILGWVDDKGFENLTPRFVVRMDEFVGPESRHTVAKDLLKYLDIDMPYDSSDADTNVFAVDSQGGSTMSRIGKKPPPFLNDADLNHIKDVVLPTAFSNRGLNCRLDGHDIILNGSVGL